MIVMFLMAFGLVGFRLLRGPKLREYLGLLAMRALGNFSIRATR